MTVTKPAVPLCLALLLCGPARGQTLHTFSGTQPGERLGWSLCAVEDVDGDGVGDLALGVPFAPVGSVQVGTVELRSGRDGALLRTLDGDAALDHAGWALAALGDLDGDGRGDLALGLPDSDLGGLDAGCVRVVSGASGATLRQHLGLAPGEGLGSALARAGDCDGDGIADLLLGAWRADAGGAEAGRVELRSGRTGALLRQHAGLQAGDRLGIALAGVGDVDGDGRDDYALGADQGGNGPGYVRVHSGRTGALLRQHVGAGPRDALGAALAGLGDVDGDLRADYALGAPQALAGAGRVLIVSGAAGSVLRELQGQQAGDELGSALAAGFDLDQDGVGDLLAGAPFAAGGHGAARAFSGAIDSELAAWTGTAGGDRMGQAVAALGDLDGDGSSDLALGAPREDLGALDGGVARVVSGAKVCAPAPYCAAKPSSQGCIPSVDWSGSPTLSGPDDFVVLCRQVLSNKTGIAFYGLAPSSLPALGGTLCVAPPFQRGPALASGGNPPPEDCSGVLAWPVPQTFLKAHGWSAGTTLHVQFWSRDPAHPDGTGVSLSDALRFELCP